MRNSFFDLDQDSTIISMLTNPEQGHDSQASKILSIFRILLVCVAVSLSIVYLRGGSP